MVLWRFKVGVLENISTDSARNWLFAENMYYIVLR